jgi:cardiolipin synthase (CMP-forming)
MNLPNLLSLLRIFMVAPFLIAVIYDRHALALVIFVVAGFTDFLDGYLARRLQQKSVLGTFLDPLGDKLLGTVAFIALSVQGLLPAWLAVIVVAKDLYVALGAGILHYSGNLTVALPSFWGKFATLLQIVTVALVLLGTFVAMAPVLLDILFIVTALVTTIACVHYIWSGARVFKES